MRRYLAVELPQIAVINLLDEGLLKSAQERGDVTAGAVRRLVAMVVAAQEAGAELALMTCSSFSSAAGLVQQCADIPVCAIDEAMLTEAVRLGTRLGLLATQPTSIRSARAMIAAIAERAARPVTVTSAVADGAFAALLAGQTERHDELVRAAISPLAAVSDVIVLTQVSMARAQQGMPDPGVPVLTSPAFAVRRIKEAMQL